jgi:hypothetical protein
MEKASLYYYISTKKNLLYQISRASLEHVSAGVKGALEQVSWPVDRVHALITSHVVSLLQHQSCYRAANDELYASPRREGQKSSPCAMSMSSFCEKPWTMPKLREYSAPTSQPIPWPRPARNDQP